ncbi:hypothetical protein PRUPE_6G275200, partial [Prunus persica]
ACTFSNGTETDRLALLAIKAQVIKDPHGIFSSWNDSLHCCNWTGLNLELNHFHNVIPQEIGHLFRLKYLNLSNNSLIWLRLGFNKLIGKIPFQLGSLQKLHYNNLSGLLPSSIGNLSSVKSLSLAVNSLEGKIPDSLGRLKNLEFLGLGLNQLSVDFGGLTSLWWLVLASNSLGTGEADDLSFFNSLSRCRNLQILDLSDNQFGGVLPNSISNFSNQLVSLRLGRNQLSGSIPSGIENNFVNLTELTMEKNNFSGSIPAIIGNLWMLRRLDLSENEFSGQIPSSLANITQLYALYLQKNRLTGTIPLSFGILSYLQELDLSQNHLNGTIPKQLMSQSSLTISLNLAHNQLTGSLPSEFLERTSRLGSFTLLLIWPNSSFFQHFSLVNLNLSFNHFEGGVPTGGVFKNTSAISVAGNQKLCGGIPELEFPACIASKPKKRKISQGLKLMILLLSGLLGLVLVMPLLVIWRLRKMKAKPSTDASPTKEFHLKVSYETLLQATGGFSSANLIGTGSFGSVYIGILGPNDTAVAVKVLYLHQEGALKSFVAECEALRNIWHRNLVKILTDCSSLDFQGNDFKSLIYEHMPNGSLESWLHPISEAGDVDGDLRILSLLQRLNIAIDVASALDYLHHHCQDPIPSNILLDNDLIAHVGDFGLARFVPEATTRCNLNQSSSVGLKGTVGYAAPEYGMGSTITTYGDVYSFGILLWEMFTGKKPTDDMFKDGMQLHNFVSNALPEQISEILDPLFVEGGRGEDEELTYEEKCIVGQGKDDLNQDCLVAILKIGVACSVESPRGRMDISHVVKVLKQVRDTLIGSALN